MRELETASDRRGLLPGGSRATFLALFYRSGDPASEAVRAACSGWLAAPGFEAVAVDIDAAPELAAWFGLATVPALAAIFDGSLLCVDQEVGPAACARLVDVARRQRALFKEIQP